MERFAGVEARVCAGRNSSKSVGAARERSRRQLGGILSRGGRFKRAQNHWPFFHVSRARETFANRGPSHAIQCAVSLGGAGWPRNRNRRRSGSSSHSDSLLLARGGAGIQEREHHGGCAWHGKATPARSQGRDRSTSC